MDSTQTTRDAREAREDREEIFPLIFFAVIVSFAFFVWYAVGPFRNSRN
jgi:hypothetical protein